MNNMVQDRFRLDVYKRQMLENRTGYTELRKGIDHVLQMSKNAMFVNHAEVEGMMEKVYGRMRCV